MFEKVNPKHPDKIADRIAGAIVDLAYKENKNPRIAVEVLVGHGKCHIIAETSVYLDRKDVIKVARRIAGRVYVDYVEVPQDLHLADNQSEKIRCGDNGIFKGVPLTKEQKSLSEIARKIYANHHSDGKYIMDGEKLIICQSKAKDYELHKKYPKAIINPLGDWTGGTDVDTGATNRKLGSDMADSSLAVSSWQDLSKADVSVNIYCFLKAQPLIKLSRFHVPLETSISTTGLMKRLSDCENFINGLGGLKVCGMGVVLMAKTTKVKLLKLEKLIPYVNNARTHSPEQISKLRSSLREFGFINPVIIDKISISSQVMVVCLRQS